mmetsp:Transcript_21349/g.58724  ORF Transcript_21349/g.58724 Transcript_21349/m.58724 type:complete len:84 (-) Transcript_21349:478-729(-)|eukprot:scaffold98677_cov39-Tisochrysis_lutea.AAC.2
MAAQPPDDPSNLMSSLEALDRAEPISAEDDLILRMQAVSKVRAEKSKAIWKKGASRTGASTSKPKHSIEKKRRKPKCDIVMRM